MLRAISIFRILKIIIANIALLTLLLAGNSFCFGQKQDSLPTLNYFHRLFKREKKIEILTGISWQDNWKDENNDNTLRYMEIGIAKSIHDYGRHGPVSFGVYACEEIYFGNENIYGTKLGAYTHYLFDLGFSMIYYTDFKRGNFKLRPELGFGIGALRAVAGFNIPTIGNKVIEKLRKNNAQLIIQFLIPVKKKIINQEGSIIKHLFKN